MNGLSIIGRTLSQPDNVIDRSGRPWQYNSRSDHHSKVSCWAILFDLLLTSHVLREHVNRGLIGFGLNHVMTDFRQNKSKKLDLVLCRPLGPTSAPAFTFGLLAAKYRISLTVEQQEQVDGLPILRQVPVGAVLMALEAKAAMTAHVRACPRLYDELNSSHSIIHGHNQTSIAAGLVMVNIAPRFYSSDINSVPGRPPIESSHRQPRDTARIIDTVQGLPRRSNTAEAGFDALAIVVIDCANDGSTVRVINTPPAPERGGNFHYETLVHRVCHIYQSRFPQA
jgi:hypothetical protein